MIVIDAAPSLLTRSKTLATLLGDVEKMKSAQPKAPVPVSATAPVLLPHWPAGVRAIPNGLLRSALFGAIKKGARRYMRGELLAGLDGVEIRQTGLQLDQGDFDLWASVLHAVRLQELGSQCRITSYLLLKIMGVTDTGKNRTILQARIERLVANALTIKQGRYTYIGSLIVRAGKDEKTQEWVIELDAKLRPLFAGDQFTQIGWAVRHALSGKPLAQWLHGFYASHAKPYPVRVETLHRLCGSDAELRRYRQTLGDALAAVAEASAAHGEGFSYEMRGDLVYVDKQASGPQQRHLAKNAAKHRRLRI